MSSFRNIVCFCARKEVGDALGSRGSCCSHPPGGMGMWGGAVTSQLLPYMHETLSPWKNPCAYSQTPQLCSLLWADSTWCEEIFSLLVLCLLNFLAISFWEWLRHDTSGNICHCIHKTGCCCFFVLIMGTVFITCSFKCIYLIWSTIIIPLKGTKHTWRQNSLGRKQLSYIKFSNWKVKDLSHISNYESDRFLAFSKVLVSQNNIYRLSV